MKCYLITIQYNKDKDAENRPQPRMFDDFHRAETAFYKQVGEDMGNASLGGSINMVINSELGEYADLKKKWGKMEADVQPEEAEAVTE